MANSNNLVAFQGIAGANSDIACRNMYPYMETKAYPSFTEVFQAIINDEVAIGMIPVENSYAGRVAEIHNLLPDNNLSIVGEYFLSVENFLMTTHGSTLDDITTIYSHPQPLLQCKKYLDKLTNVELCTTSNTAVAAEFVAKEKNKHKAAIASKLAAELYNLDIIAKNIEDAPDNKTLFLAFAKDPIDPDINKKTIMSVIFTARNMPAALYKALGGFATNNVNLLKLESYIPSGISKEAKFFMSFEGHPSQRNVQLALEELSFFCKKVHIFGVYVADKSRYANDK